jgi:hypothetical protein
MFLARYELGFYIPEDGILHSHRRENLKSYMETRIFRHERGAAEASPCLQSPLRTNWSVWARCHSSATCGHETCQLMQSCGPWFPYITNKTSDSY